jgi:hypothetical protein
MKQELIQLQEIDEFLSGELKPEHLAEFEKRLAEEEDVRDDVEITKNVIQGVQASAFRDMLHRIHGRIHG